MSLAAVSEPINAEPMFWTKWEHGSLPVSKKENKWVIHYPDGAQEFRSGRALMRAIHNGRDPHLQVERYFKAGKWNKKSAKRKIADVIPFPTQITTLDLFGVKVEETPPAPTIALGIDLESRSLEVKKLLYAGFGRRIVAMGYDPEDVLQEVYKGLLARNLGSCPWDARKSSFGHYVHMVCGCILSNYHRKYNRINSQETIGVFMMRDGGLCEVDVAESNYAWEDGDQGDAIQESELLVELNQALKKLSADGPLEDGKYCKRELSLQILPLLVDGWKRREIAGHLEIREGIITKCINLIRRVTQQLWGLSPNWV